MELKEAFEKFNIDTYGVCDASLFNKETGKNYKVCIVALFPYFCGYPDKYNLSIYTHGKDYHRVTHDILTSVAEKMDLAEYEVHSDTGPHIDRRLAVNAGLCFVGRNNMCINEKYGSYFFIGYIACNADIPLSTPTDRLCVGCNKCLESCPGGALGDSGFDEAKCLSAITQKKGELTGKETELLKKSGIVFGCDICQSVCPHNEGVIHTPIDAFVNSRITSIEYDELISMSNREFREKFGDRAFSWRGKKVIERNLELQNKC